MQERSQIVCDSLCRDRTRGRHFVERHEPVNEPDLTSQDDLDSGLGEVGGVGFTLIAQRVKLCGHHKSLGEHREVLRE